MPKKLKPVVTAPVGKVSSLEENPTGSNFPVVGTIYRDLVELKETVELLDEIVHGEVSSSGSRVKETLAETEAQDGEEFVPTYASPVSTLRMSQEFKGMSLTISIENRCSIWPVTIGISPVYIQDDTRLCCALVRERSGGGHRAKCQQRGGSDRLKQHDERE